jgi:hypothetical protein
MNFHEFLLKHQLIGVFLSNQSCLPFPPNKQIEEDASEH